MAKASTNLGYPTYVYSRPTSPNIDLLNEFHSSGVTIFKGALDEREKLVSVLKEVDIVISALACPQVLDQLKIIEAIKVAGNIKRFLPSDFGCEEDRVTVLPSYQEFLNKKKNIRRATELAEGIPYTFVSTNCFGAYFVSYLLRPHDHEKEDITVYGSGEAKVVFIYEEDIGSYTIRVANDPSSGGNKKKFSVGTKVYQSPRTYQYRSYI
ncbi:eugenol synthase 1-like [Coffea eugenioides]|uniref:eugenol synthase 1-like n=1 Tax=Coffea eugenioides TaxID=49369 RepID=UPI000F607EAE|nr:eugenol synthase 1-like [Coffea eugenioides]